MSEAQDPERLLADALRAQARSAPPAGPSGTTPPSPHPQKPVVSADATPNLDLGASPQTRLPTPEMLSRYGLLSGAAPGSLERERAALETPGAISAAPSKRASLSAYSILLLAVLLGLVTGAVVGIVTLLWPA